MRALIIILTLGSFFLSAFTPVPAQAASIDLTFQDDVLSANLKEVRLKDVLERLEREKGISWKVDFSLLEEKITVQFTDLYLHKGVKRILGSMNHSLIFDENERLACVIIIGEKTHDKVTPKGRMVAQNKRTQQNQDVKAEKISGASSGPVPESFKVMRNVTLPGSSSEPTAEEMEKFKVIKNLPPPGGSTQVSEEVLESFKVRKNLPPPGGTPQVSKEALESLKVRKNLPPPGGAPQVSEEVLESLKVRKNLPPPGGTN